MKPLTAWQMQNLSRHFAKKLSSNEQQEVMTLRKRIAKAERRIIKGVRVAEETARIARLQERIITINAVNRDESTQTGDYERFMRSE